MGRRLELGVCVGVWAGGVGWGLGLLLGGLRRWAAGLGSAFGASAGAGPAGAGQAMAQLLPLWCRPRLVRRARLTAAARSASQCRFFAAQR